MTQKFKKCTSCNISKPIEMFGKDVQQVSGIKPYCKVCVSTRRKDEYKRNKVRVKITTNSYYQKNKDMLIKNAYVREKANGKLAARQKLRNEVMAGRILKEPCFCGDIKVEAHHYLGYKDEHWKDVKWLCKHHHLQEHGKELIYVSG